MPPPSGTVHALPASTPASDPAEPPAETDAWWLTRSEVPTFARRRIAVPEACARALWRSGVALGRLVVQFNGASFSGATLAESGGGFELLPGDALAREMADVLDEDDGLEVELLPGRGEPTLAIHPYLRATR